MSLTLKQTLEGAPLLVSWDKTLDNEHRFKEQLTNQFQCLFRRQLFQTLNESEILCVRPNILVLLVPAHQALPDSLGLRMPPSHSALRPFVVFFANICEETRAQTRSRPVCDVRPEDVREIIHVVATRGEGVGKRTTTVLCACSSDFMAPAASVFTCAYAFALAFAAVVADLKHYTLMKGGDSEGAETYLTLSS